MKKVRKAIISAADPGIGMLPITSVVPKELLPVCGRPVIQYVVEEAVSAGIEEVILVLSEGKGPVADYFRPNRKLEAQLLANGKHDELRQLEKLWNMTKITAVIKNDQKGLGHAILCAKDAIGNEPFAVLLGDTIIHTQDCVSFISKMISAFDKHERSIVGLQTIGRCSTSQYGIFEGSDFENGILKAQRVSEKPADNGANLNNAFCARYVFQPEIFELLAKTQVDKNNEIQLTDAMQVISQTSGLLGLLLEGEHFNIDDPNGLLLANLSLTQIMH